MWQTVHTPLHVLTVWIAQVIYVLCWSTIFIPIDTQIHPINLHYLIVPPSVVFNFPHILYDIFIFFMSSVAKKAATLTICCLSYFYFFPCALLYSCVIAIKSAISIIITIHRVFLVCFTILFHY